LIAVQPHKGGLLIAEPSILNDDSFKRSIVLLTEHSNDSSVGFILNRPLQFTLSDILPDIDCDFMVYQGGPVEQDNLYFIHSIPHLIPNSIEVTKGIYWGGNFETLRELIELKLVESNQVRFFLGYSGWDREKLESEMINNSWFATKNDYSNLLSIDIKSLWRNKLIQKGGKYKIWANAPTDFNLN